MQALSSSRLTLVCFILGLFLFIISNPSLVAFINHHLCIKHLKQEILWSVHSCHENMITIPCLFQLRIITVM